MTQAATDTIALDNRLSNRFIELDPSGYFIIYVDYETQLIYAEHYSNTIDEKGLACDPETGEPLACNGKLARKPMTIYKGRTAKELCIEIFEKPEVCCISRLDHAAYLGREFVRAEMALLRDSEYIQD